MTSEFELTTLAKLIHEDTIAKAQQRRFVRSVKKLRQVPSNEHHEFLIREGEPCRC